MSDPRDLVNQRIRALHRERDEIQRDRERPVAEQIAEAVLPDGSPIEDVLREAVRIERSRQLYAADIHALLGPAFALRSDLGMAGVEYGADVTLVLPRALLATVPDGTTLWGVPMIHADVERAGLLLVPHA